VETHRKESAPIFSRQWP